MQTNVKINLFWKSNAVVVFARLLLQPYRHSASIKTKVEFIAHRQRLFLSLGVFLRIACVYLHLIISLLSIYLFILVCWRYSTVTAYKFIVTDTVFVVFAREPKNKYVTKIISKKLVIQLQVDSIRCARTCILF